MRTIVQHIPGIMLIGFNNEGEFRIEGKNRAGGKNLRKVIGGYRKLKKLRLYFLRRVSIEFPQRFVPEHRAEFRRKQNKLQAVRLMKIKKGKKREKSTQKTLRILYTVALHFG